MHNYGLVRSVVKPEALKVDSESVWICNNIKKISETVGEDLFEGYEYEMIRYPKDEYIQVLTEKNSSLASQITDAQFALVELYESVVNI